MSVSMKDLGIDKLSEEERRRLAYEILESAGMPPNVELTPERVQALRRRLEEVRANPDHAIPWDEFWSKF